MCGCGGKAPIAPMNDKRYGIVKGKPQRYIKGHQHFKSGVEYIVDESGCWVSQRSVNTAGYCHGYIDGVHKYAHVHAYEKAHGPVPDGMFVHHTCHNKRCVNPAHLECYDREEHHRKHGICKLTQDDVRQIRKLHSEGTSQGDIRGLFHISQSHCSAIINRRFWKNVA